MKQVYIVPTAKCIVLRGEGLIATSPSTERRESIEGVKEMENVVFESNSKGGEMWE